MSIKLRFAITIGTLYLLLASFLLYVAKHNSMALIVSQVVLLLLLLAICYFYRLIIRPVDIINSGADLLKEQDFSSRLTNIGHPDIDKLINLFNRMMDQLKEERLRVREQHYFLDLLVKASPMGIIILDFDDKISTINPAASRLLAGTDVVGHKLSDVQHPLAQEMALLTPDEQTIVRINGIHAYRCTLSAFIDRGFPHPFILVEELTTELIKTEKKAFEKVIRLMSHEVNNTIGATNSMLSLLDTNLQKSHLPYSDDFSNVIAIATERGAKLCELMSNFSEVVKIPQPMRKPVSLKSLIDSVHLLLEAECQKRSITLTVDMPEHAPSIYADVVQMEQVVINIVKNSIEAIERNGAISIRIGTNPTTLVVEDNGKGISKEEQSKLFTPFYSTKNNGQGIGLMFVREILINHQFQLSLQTVEPRRTEFKITFS